MSSWSWNDTSVPFYVRNLDTDFSGDIADISLQCTGNSLATAKDIPLVGPLQVLNAYIRASWIDASNFGVIFPAENLWPVQYHVFALDGTAGGTGSAQSVTVFAPAGYEFNGGASSLLIPVGSGKILSTPGNDNGSGNIVISVIG